MVEGRGNMGRTPFLTQTDFMVGHTVKFGEIKRLRFEFNALNVFNQKTARHRFTSLNRGAGAGGGRPASAIDLSGTDLFQGFDYRTMLAETADRSRDRGAYRSAVRVVGYLQPGIRGPFRCEVYVLVRDGSRGHQLRGPCFVYNLPSRSSGVPLRYTGPSRPRGLLAALSQPRLRERLPPASRPLPLPPESPRPQSPAQIPIA